ncbi:MAG: serine/threonine-protein kinase, partial [Planctomycetota bacterium]|nr:serine/threonine-protein kinase [Planctomycetota bacterium]
MTGSRSELDESSNSEVDGVIAAMLISLEQGTPLKLEDWVARYPDLEEKLRDFFQDHVRMEAALADPGQSASALHAGESAEPPDSFADMENQSFGDYLLVKEIDRGGMGVIFEAHDQRLNRRVAIKMIKSGGLASATEVARFHAEANSAASLDHAHIVPVYDSGQIQGLHFFSMALIEGETLSAKIMKGPLDVQEAVMVAKKISSAIAYAHREGVIHRDLKPGNILIDQNNEPRITDFGLAHNPNMNQQLTTDGQILGTPAYMPPEQARGQSVAANPAADVYSIGAILFHCLTAQAPHTADNPLDVLLRVQEVAPLPPHKLNPKVSKPLSDIVLRCLEKKPANRYETATQLERDLDRF